MPALDHSKPNVMISYARADARDFAGRLAAELKHNGIDAWLDTSESEGGAEWLRRIQEAIDASTVFIAVRSPAASDSFWVRSERLYALNRRKPPDPLPYIVPVVAAPCTEDDLELISFQPVDFAHSFEMALPVLLERIRTLRDGHAPETRDRRELELAYLGRILLEHSIWQDLYTPMAGVAQLRKARPQADKPQMVTVPNRIGQKFRERIREELHREELTETEQREYDDILPAIEQMRQLVILGDPGSGKTTTLWRIAADYARRAEADASAPLPVFVRLGALRSDQTPEAQVRASLGELGEHYDALLAEKRLAFLLDGLNELPAENRSEQVGRIRTLVQRCQRDELAVAVTCRELDYTSAIDLNIPQQVRITPLDAFRIRQFVNGYIKEPKGAGDTLFWALAGGNEVRTTWETWEQAGATFDLFWTASDIPRENPNVYGRTSGTQNRIWREAVHGDRSMMKLARNPYMLYMMTQVFTEEGEIPQNRGRLFKLFVDFLLLDREQMPQADAETLTTRLSALAYQMQARGEAGTSVSRTDALAVLGNEQRLYQAQSANILSGTYAVRFTHQLLQEFFAAHKLDREMQGGIPATEYWPPDRWWEPAGWEETAILLAGLYSDDCTPVLEWLRDANPELAARCVLESGAHTLPATIHKLQPHWLPRLTDIKREPQPQGRAAVGRAIGMLELDNRAGVLAPERIPDIAWSNPIAAGTFRLGGDPAAYDAWDGGEFRLDYLFWIAKYPVTYAQYAAFMAAGGYQERRYWTEAGWADKGERTEPYLWNDARWRIANHPVIGVSWYEAYAFAMWLDELRQQGKLRLPEGVPGKYAIRLPRECEWEKAARYPDGRLFPWGSEWDAARLNSSESRLQRTTAVGLYPNGRNPALDVYDLSGNVWEWCLTAWRDEYEKPEAENNDPQGNDDRRGARGGSWYYYDNHARAAARLRGNPDLRFYYRGFRVVCSVPISSVNLESGESGI